MKFALGFISAAVVFLLAAGILTYAGWYNVAAVAGLHPRLAWALHKTMESSVRRRAANIAPPPDLTSLVPQGFQDFDERCVQCHGAPGPD